MTRRAMLLLILMCFSIAGVGVFISISFAQPVQNSSPTWHYEEIDVPGFYFGMGDRSLRVNAEGVPHLVYGGNHLYLARYQDGVWNSEVVDDGVSVGEGASLALDTAGRPHIAYKDTLRMKLKYAYWNGVHWQIENLGDVTNWIMLNTAIDVDPAGRPHIIYIGEDVDGSGLYHTYKNGGSWEVEMVTGGNVSSPSIAIDGAGKVHISFSDYDSDHVRYGGREPGGWVLEDVGSISYPALGTSLALDSSGQPQIAYLSNVSIKYATRLEGIWSPISVGTSLSEIGISLILDEADKPHIADSKSRFIFDGTEWQTEQIPGMKGTFYESIAFDGDSQPIISALTYGGPLQCAHYDGEQWIVDELAYGETTGSGNALAVNRDGQLSATYYDDPSDQLMYAVRQSGGWVTNVITTAVANYPRKTTDLVIDTADRPHVAFGRFGQLIYAFWNGNEWLFEEIDDFDGSLTLVIDSLDRPHATYLEHGWVHYAVRHDDDWQIEEVHQTDEAVSLALDSENQPHIAYFEETGEPELALRHAIRSESGWITDTVDSGDSVNSVAIAVDEDDNPHVAYFFKGDQCDLRYANRIGGEWQIETVAEWLCQGEEVHLALDDLGRPHIAYWDYYLHYYIQDESGWQSGFASPVRQTGLVVPGRVYDHDMIVTDSRVYLSFTYEPNRGLLLASSWPFDLSESVYLPLITQY